VRAAASLVLLAALAAPAQAQWTGAIDEYGLRRATTQGEAYFGSTRVPARLTLLCRPGEDGIVAWELALSESSRLADFGFADFEGPDARAAKARLTEIVPEGGPARTAFYAAAAGYYGTEPDVFVLSVSAPANAASDVARLGESVGVRTETLQWSTRSLAIEGAALVARFPTSDAASVVREAMMGCGPAPELEPSALERALGQDPGETKLFEQRALDWRLKSLLGREHDALLARLARAQPLARDGEVWYVLAPPGAGHGATVVMFERSGATEVVLADPDGTRRLKSGGAAIKPPAAVREFLANSR
jgi:hypothetical protein